MIGCSIVIVYTTVGALCGVVTLCSWHWLLKNPGGINGLIMGVLVNLVAFAVMHQIDRTVKALEGKPGLSA